MIGRQFGRLTVLSLFRKDEKHRKYWNCICSCGGTAIPRGDALTMGRARSCGCLQREAATRNGLASRRHNYKGTPTYDTWSHMIDRCHNSNNGRYEDYGGRGITVCDRWRENFLNFLADMGEKPGRLTLERINNDEGYEPMNCRWATYAEQAKNKRPYATGFYATGRV